jgi:hypothetical protein
MGLSLLEVPLSIFSAPSFRAVTPTPKRGGLALLGAIGGLSLLGATGCVARVHGEARYRAPEVAVVAPVVTVQEPEPIVYVDAVPADIETYPRAEYRGSYVYYVDGRWCRPAANGWVYFRTEPRELVSYRVEFERSHPRVRARASTRAVVQPTVEVQTRAVAQPTVEVQSRAAAQPTVEVQRRAVAQPTVDVRARAVVPQPPRLDVKAGVKARASVSGGVSGGVSGR